MALDVMGYSLHYYSGDYLPVVSGNSAFVATQTSSDLVNTSYSKDMYNGNIARMVTTITNPNTRAKLPLGNVYKHDQLNRLSSSISFTNINTSTNTWGSGGTGIYANNFTYDANGNILTQVRKNESGTTIDDLTYKYQQNSANKTVRNRLYGVYDHVVSGTFTDDIDSMVFANSGAINTANNYSYDEEGRLIKDVQNGIAQITWRVDGKIKEIKRYSESGANMRFDYDAMGHRIAKHIYTEDFTDLIKSTYYILDAGGNVVSVYEREINSPSVNFTQREKFIYGSSRIGVLRDSIALLGSQNANYSQVIWNHVIGKRNYELNNHLGNVLTIISDKPIPHTSGSLTDFFLADIRQATDYSGFGVQLSGRTLTLNAVSREYRYTFQGQEHDDEIKGEGNSLNYEYRMHDPRLGRFFAIDPLTADYPWYTPYQFSGNKVIAFVELEGLEEKNVTYYNMHKDKNGDYQPHKSWSSSNLIVKSENAWYKDSKTGQLTAISSGNYFAQSSFTGVYTYWNTDGTIKKQIVKSASNNFLQMQGFRAKFLADNMPPPNNYAPIGQMAPDGKYYTSCLSCHSPAGAYWDDMRMSGIDNAALHFYGNIMLAGLGGALNIESTAINSMTAEELSFDVSARQLLNPSRANMPRTVTTMTYEGTVSVGYNGAPAIGQWSSSLGTPTTSLERWSVLQCAEPKALNSLLLNGANRSGISSSTMGINKGTFYTLDGYPGLRFNFGRYAFPKAPCSNCSVTLKGLNRH